jgi:polyisoprenoid-binding protein YceI
MKMTHLASALLVSLAPLAADASLSTSGGSSVTFHATGPAGMRIDGHTSDLSVADDAQNVTVTVPLRNLSTGIGLRDHHMRDKYLEVGRYPNAELVVRKSALRFPQGGSQTSGDATGTMKIHGRTASTTFHYSARRDGSIIHVTGTAQVDMRDYGIRVPSYLGITVKPNVGVDVQFGVQQ